MEKQKADRVKERKKRTLGPGPRNLPKRFALVAGI